MHSRLIRLIGAVFSNGTMLSASDKSNSVNEHTQERINEITYSRLWQNGHHKNY